ncbi:type II toxin-antitoxin system RelE/ParE family toxin [Mesorhizobium retamae]|uniref:Type II toxin-antitoxin system RelE/ParE family toxin n=1 Tax=Mesorhizobium retamae TaxID=2912854 RepID=A0ABS9QLV8_9HYPH|nr:type II toxin-antitoxin system RelE/ParE family toxin [Mesorhizobium sp. IRAMC:0171]MCG7508433.1 type II toxin-antitoxin system RelE/ParE family toxin [Mesorhizobium sp. IRAMC:0171]
MVQKRRKVSAAIRRLSLGNPGTIKPVGEGVSEMKTDFGPGYRIYFIRHGPVVVVLLCGGDKSSQDQDVVTAKAIAAQWKEQR